MVRLADRDEPVVRRTCASDFGCSRSGSAAGASDGDIFTWVA